MDNLRKLIIIDIFLLFVQFGLGMWNNLFAIVPLKAPFSFFSYIGTGGLDVLAHTINGWLILVFTGLIVWFSYKTENSLVLKLSALAIVFTISAIVNGTIFLEIFSVPSLYSIGNYFSFAMALSFISVFAVSFTEIYVIKKSPTAR